MAKYIPRLTAPGASDKNWIHTSAGGYNYCIHIANGSCLPNCVGYAWGRWRELLGAHHRLSRMNAENWWGTTSDGYQRGQTPKVGAVICWRKGKAGVGSDGAGHVAIVEQVNADGSIITSNSGYSGTRFYTQTLKPPYSIGNAYTLQGFIYIPLDFDETTINNDLATEKKEEETTVKIELNVLKKGATGAQVKTLQRLLTSLGYAMTSGGRAYGVDGSFGTATYNALISFQRARKLEVDGVCGPATWEALLK